MDIADVRRRLHETMARAKQHAAERRARSDAAARAFEIFLNGTAVPLVRQVANVLRADGYLFSVITPAGTVRLISDKAAEDFIEIALDTSGEAPRVVGRISRSRGRRGFSAERVIGSGDPESISDEELFRFLAAELEPFVER